MSPTPSDAARAEPSQRDYAIEVLLMLLATLPVLASAYASHATGDGQWFQRSGALMVLFSVGVQYHRTYWLRCVERQGPRAGRGPARWVRVIGRFWHSIPYVCYLAIVMGTLIWSYGDLMFG
ncbi:hypothetical protein [Halomonas koreensis]|uniref:Uncharacterized protein n=1 Tax=Halomonas koreensis TaxID=245385 RepID=A0ABU1G2J8_9GAMM|nr:hypothetical protein [Halomonas koreensis]MDR5866793.1 hypothetical protein [Halomonas koreensis]